MQKSKLKDNQELRKVYAKNSQGQQELVTVIVPKGTGYVGGTKKGFKFKKNKQNKPQKQNPKPNRITRSYDSKPVKYKLNKK